EPSLVRIDHVIYAAADLAAATARVEAALGVAADPGGHHSGLGTHNAILPLGGGYLEVLAIDDLEVSCDPSRLEPWLGGQTLPVRFGAGAPGVVAIGVGGGELRSP